MSKKKLYTKQGLITAWGFRDGLVQQKRVGSRVVTMALGPAASGVETLRIESRGLDGRTHESKRTTLSGLGLARAIYANMLQRAEDAALREGIDHASA